MAFEWNKVDKKFKWNRSLSSVSLNNSLRRVVWAHELEGFYEFSYHFYVVFKIHKKFTTQKLFIIKLI